MTLPFRMHKTQVDVVFRYGDYTHCARIYLTTKT